jgi:hypothetical protein
MRRQRPADGHQWSIRTIERFDQRVTPFFEDAARSFDAIRERDAAYLNWRYGDARGGPFEVRVAEQDGAILGYAVVRCLGPRAYLADLLARSERLDVVNALLDDAVALARARGSVMIEAWLCERHQYAPLLRKRGFRQRASGAVLAHRAFGAHAGDFDFLSDPDVRIHAVLGDFDHI